jgi:hypothetical protein
VLLVSRSKVIFFLSDLSTRFCTASFKEHVKTQQTCTMPGSVYNLPDAGALLADFMDSESVAVIPSSAKRSSTQVLQLLAALMTQRVFPCIQNPLLLG